MSSKTEPEATLFPAPFGANRDVPFFPVSRRIFSYIEFQPTPSSMKKIGFLSFGHWNASPHSAARSARDVLQQSIELSVVAETLAMIRRHNHQGRAAQGRHLLEQRAQRAIDEGNFPVVRLRRVLRRELRRRTVG